MERKKERGSKVERQKETKQHKVRAREKQKRKIKGKAREAEMKGKVREENNFRSLSKIQREPYRGKERIFHFISPVVNNSAPHMCVENRHYSGGNEP